MFSGASNHRVLAPAVDDYSAKVDIAVVWIAFDHCNIDGGVCLRSHWRLTADNASDGLTSERYEGHWRKAAKCPGPRRNSRKVFGPGQPLCHGQLAISHVTIERLGAKGRCMAVDYYHHIVVTGPRPAVSDFVNRIALVVSRRVGGVTHQVTVPFSFESMFAMAKMRGKVPCDPYDMTRWPLVQRGRMAEARYRFHTRNLEMQSLLKRLSRAVPQLHFALVTMCLDDSDIAPFTIQNGRLRGKWLPGTWHEPFWQRAARKYKMSLDDAYQDDVAEAAAESWMMDEAMRKATGSPRRYHWTGGRIYRNLQDVRDALIRELAEA